MSNKRKNDILLSDDGYLLHKTIHQDDVLGEIDLSKLDLNSINETASLSHETFQKCKQLQETMKAKLMKGELSEKEKHEYYINKMCSGYNSRQEGDRFFWYNDMRGLAGSAGYLQIRDGYVIDQLRVMMS